MKHSRDPFEAAIEEQEESPPESPVGGGDGSDDGRIETEQTPEEDERAMGKTSVVAESKSKYEMEKEEEENMEVVELTKYPTTTADPVKMAKMKTILAQFTEAQMSRYESFRRSAFQKGNMKKLLQNVTGSQKSDPLINIVVCGITKMFVGELVETARIDMGERKESGPIRPCHIRESFRRLKLQGKVPKRSIQRLFR